MNSQPTKKQLLWQIRKKCLELNRARAPHGFRLRMSMTMDYERAVEYYKDTWKGRKKVILPGQFIGKRGSLNPEDIKLVDFGCCLYVDRLPRGGWDEQIEIEVCEHCQGKGFIAKE